MNENAVNLDKKYQCLYSLVYSWIPSIINNINEHGWSLSTLLNIDSWKKVLEDNDPERANYYCWEEINCNIVQLGNCHMIVYQFPEPFRSPLAKYGAVTIDKEQNKVMNYVTLEMGRTSGADIWVLGLPTKSDHSFYGIFNGEPTKENFIDAVMNMQNKLSQINDICPNTHFLLYNYIN